MILGYVESSILVIHMHEFISAQLQLGADFK